MIQFYKPNSKNTGHAASFRLVGDVVYLEIIKQSGWNDTTKTGSFAGSRNDPNKKINIKFNTVELAALVRAIKYNVGADVQGSGVGEPVLYHRSEKGMTTIKFLPYFAPAKPQEQPIQKGFSLSVFAKGNQGAADKNFLLGFTFAESELIQNFFEYCLRMIFSFSEKKYIANGKNQNRQPDVAAPAEAAEEDPVEAFLSGETFDIKQ